MAVIIGSARLDEHGGSGWSGKAKAGDQKQTKTPDYTGEVSMQNWYKHSKGWVVLRPKSMDVALKIAKAMEAACNNKHIGYDQSQRDTLYTAAKKVGFDISKVKTDCETDCSALVRVCCCYAGFDPGNFRTANEVEALMKTGKFEKLTETKFTAYSTNIRKGDILVTKTSGHTVVVLTNGSNIKIETAPEGPGGETNKKVVKATKPAAKKSDSLAGTYHVTAKNGLRLRNGAGTGETILCVLPYKHEVKNYGFYSIVGGQRWLYVATELKGVEYIGFCSAAYLSK